MPPVTQQRDKEQSKDKEQPMATKQQTPEEYLRSKGWVYVGSEGVDLWNDPRASRESAKEQTFGTLKNTSGGDEPIKQHVGPLLPWDYTTDEAIQIQRDLDAKKV